MKKNLYIANLLVAKTLANESEVTNADLYKTFSPTKTPHKR